MIVTRGLDSGGLRPAEQGALDLPIEPPGTVISPTPSSASLAGANMREWSALAREKIRGDYKT